MLRAAARTLAEQQRGSGACGGARLPGVAVAVELGSDGGHDVGLALDALLAALDVLDYALKVVQLCVPLPEHAAVRPHLQKPRKTQLSKGCFTDNSNPAFSTADLFCWSGMLTGESL